MSKRENRVREFISDVKAGMADSTLQNKYGLTNDKFDSYRKMARDVIARDEPKASRVRRKIDAHKMLADMRSGMDDDSLMAKYDLTSRGLQSALRKIIQAGMATPLEISRRFSSTDTQTKETSREMGKSMRELD